MRLKIVAVGLALPALFLALYAFFIEPIWVETRTVPISLADSPSAPHRVLKHKSVRIVLVSDFHWGPMVSSGYLRRVFKAIGEQRPDAILIAGDFYATQLVNSRRYRDLLKMLSAAAPTYAVGGNHDGGWWAQHRRGGYANTDTLRWLTTSAGIHYLENTFDCPRLNTLKVCIGGLGDAWGGFNIPALFIDAYDSTSADLKLMMVHNPDGMVFVKDNRWDVMVAGHTHGGQMVLPFIGAPWAPVIDKTRLRGLFEYAGRPLYITPGIGNSEHRARFRSRPEISVLEIRL